MSIVKALPAQTPWAACDHFLHYLSKFADFECQRSQDSDSVYPFMMRARYIFLYDLLPNYPPPSFGPNLLSYAVLPTSRPTDIANLANCQICGVPRH